VHQKKQAVRRALQDLGANDQLQPPLEQQQQNEQKASEEQEANEEREQQGEDPVFVQKEVKKEQQCEDPVGVSEQLLDNKEQEQNEQQQNSMQKEKATKISEQQKVNQDHDGEQKQAHTTSGEVSVTEDKDPVILQKDVKKEQQCEDPIVCVSEQPLDKKDEEMDEQQQDNMQNEKATKGSEQQKANHDHDGDQKQAHATSGEVSVTEHKDTKGKGKRRRLKQKTIEVDEQQLSAGMAAAQEERACLQTEAAPVLQILESLQQRQQIDCECRVPQQLVPLVAYDIAAGQCRMRGRPGHEVKALAACNACGAAVCAQCLCTAPLELLRPRGTASRALL